ncbi:GNAT family N-acetyltransferase [Paracoccus sp. (in: a-proteobacteria)]|uniref:GNAT family N-acetyltransferase n=1 Tax=Paracoccus sp. TaxID=267 RepID=UPI002B003767|nr:GNAT family N-acetyltransferase [Paracoccus sp. (in: a-proteobacteria)]
MKRSVKEDLTTEIIIRAITAEDAEAWRKLYSGYANFYSTPMADDILDRTWAWLLDPAHPLEGLIALTDGGQLVGLVHYRPFPKPLFGQDAGFLDDLFVDPGRRGSGVGRALINAVATAARERGWPLVRWITAADNGPARRLYDDVAKATPWVTYDLKP